MYDLERPFHRLIHHYIARIFYGAGDGDDLQFSIPALLGLMSTPSAFGAIQLLGKYSTLFLFLMGRPQFDIYRASLPDEYFFIVYSMVVTGAVVVLKWDRLFPDRQDYDNLAALPISARQNFMASLTALLVLASAFAVTINWAACIIFPYAVTNSYRTAAAFAEFAFAHLAAVMLASFFMCFALLLIMGVTMLVVPSRWVRQVSLAVRIMCALALAGIFGTAFTIPRILLGRELPAYVAWIPSVWFLDLHQTLMKLGMPRTGTGVFAVEVTAVAFVLAMLVYGLTYYREFMRIPERGGMNHAHGRDSESFGRRAMDVLILRTSFQKAGYHFASKTLFRSERHCLLFGTATAIGFFLGVQTISDALANPVRRGLDPRLLSVSLTGAYFMLLSLRALFDMPSDRGANWIFRSTVDLNRHESREVAAKLMVSTVVPWLIVPGLPLHAALWGWKIALLHTIYVILCSLGLAQILLFRFRKIPFTCVHTASKDRILVSIILCMVGLSFFGPANARMEASLLVSPVRFLVFLALFTAGVLWMRSFHRNLPLSERTLIFEDRPDPAVEVLSLTR